MTAIAEPTIICPKCKTEIPLTESLAAPLLEATRRQYERKLSQKDKEIEQYVASGQWEGKAGGYGIQDNDPFVTRMSGCQTAIVGLPMKTTKIMLAAAGIHPHRK